MFVLTRSSPLPCSDEDRRKRNDWIWRKCFLLPCLKPFSTVVENKTFAFSINDAHTCSSSQDIKIESTRQHNSIEVILVCSQYVSESTENVDSTFTEQCFFIQSKTRPASISPFVSRRWGEGQSLGWNDPFVFSSSSRWIILFVLDERATLFQTRKTECWSAGHGESWLYWSYQTILAD